jgi:hypothetical protein
VGNVNVTAALALDAVVVKAAPMTPAVNSVLNRDKVILPRMIIDTLPRVDVISNHT